MLHLSQIMYWYGYNSLINLFFIWNFSAHLQLISATWAGLFNVNIFCHAGFCGYWRVLYLSLVSFLKFHRELIHHRCEYDEDSHKLQETVSLIAHKQYTDHNCDYFSSGYHHGHNVLLELLNHSVNHNLAEEGKDRKHSQMESVQMMFKIVNKKLYHPEVHR